MILFVDQSGQLGGAELCLGDLAVHWRERGGRVLLLSDGPFAGWLREREVPVGIHPLPEALAGMTREAGLSRFWGAVPAAFSYVAGLRRVFNGAELLYFNTPKALLAGMAANAASRRPAVFHLHDLLVEAHFSATNRRLIVAAANRAAAVIANSHAAASAYRAAGGTAPVTVIPNGFDPAPFDAVSEATVAALRAEWNPEGRPVLAIFGRLARWKGQEVLLRAAARLPEAMVWIVGDALFTGDDRAYAEELRRRAAPDRVRFLGFRHDIPAVMRAADIVVHCSIAPEPFGRVLVEGMLARRPVVAARGGGADEIVDGVGLLTPPGDDVALEAALRRLLDSPPLREDAGKRGRERAETVYALPAVLNRTDAVLTPLLPS